MAFCVFCGSHVPKSVRTKEHIFPKWLLEATGDPNRPFDLGCHPDTGEKRIRPASTFEFPACDICNQTFGKRLESRAKPIITAISDRRSISVRQAYILLDWLDKVRVGVWLGYHMLNKEQRFHPRFHISTRIGRKDRVAVIGVDPNDKSKILQYGGHDNDLFASSQCALFLRINNIRILSLSFDFAVSQETGLPTSDSMVLLPGNTGYLKHNLLPGTYQLDPLWEDFAGLGGTVIAQPVIDTRGLAPNFAANLYFDSRVIQHAKHAISVHDMTDYSRILQLQLISNVGGPFQWYPQPLRRIRLSRTGSIIDADFMAGLYRLLLTKVARLLPFEVEAVDGRKVPSLDLLRTNAERLFQIVQRLHFLGRQTPDTSELIEDIQRFHRLIEERDAALGGTLLN